MWIIIYCNSGLRACEVLYLASDHFTAEKHDEQGVYGNEIKRTFFVKLNHLYKENLKEPIKRIKLLVIAFRIVSFIFLQFQDMLEQKMFPEQFI